MLANECLHLRISLGGTSRQGRRPDLGRRPRRDSERRQGRPSRLRDHGQDRHGHHRRRSHHRAWVDLEDLARDVILDIGYNSSELGFDGATCAVLNAIGKQSPDIAQGVDREAPEEQGAGDQGMMFGYASNETES